MALGGDLMAPPKYSASVSSNHLDEFSCLVREDDDDSLVLSSDPEAPLGVDPAAAATSMAYLPRTVVLCDFRLDCYEGGCDGGLGSIWRCKERMKTSCMALVLCLNIGNDPADVIKISPCARMECWIDPLSMVASKALAQIGKTLIAQYDRWQPRARSKVQLDPTTEEVKKLCESCRIFAKSDRVLFHYNGHGVLKPNVNGDIYVFNKDYSQYVSLEINNLDAWLSTPSIYVFDCSAAGLIVNAFIKLQGSNSTSSSDSSAKDCILLAACGAHETLPQNTEFPADVFTSCLTTPVKMALHWFCTRSLLRDSLDHSLIDKIPGRQIDRKTLLGELYWIFNAVTDAIAWNVLPHDLFQRLFRQDLFVASLFRNFLLAERIMRSANCSPVSYPELPSTHQHHMWDAWDMAAEMCLAKLPQLLDDPNAEYLPSPFFSDQLTAFEIWLDHGSEHKKPPELLPIVLQVLLSQSLRYRALVLLGRFLDMGPWAVNLALVAGIFPFALKLLHTSAMEHRQILVFIWTKILALDKSCQVDLVKDEGHVYFINYLDSMDAYPEQRAMAAFVLAIIVDGHRDGQVACVNANLIHICLKRLQPVNLHDDVALTEPFLLQWLCLCLGKLWEDFPAAQLIGLQADAPLIFASLLSALQPEVRAAAAFALGNLLGVETDTFTNGHALGQDCDDDEKVKTDFHIVKCLLQIVGDGSLLVRSEVAVALSRFVFVHTKNLKLVSATYLKSSLNSVLNSSPSLININSLSSSYANAGMQSGIAVSSNIGPVFRINSDYGSLSSSSPLRYSGIMHGSPLSDDSSQHSGSGNSRSTPSENSIYLQCILSMYTLAKDPSPMIAKLGRRVLSIIGIEQVVTGASRINCQSNHQGEVSTSTVSPSPSVLGRSFSWFEMNSDLLSKMFSTSTVSPPRKNDLVGIRRVCSLEFSHHKLNSSCAQLVDPLLCNGSSEFDKRSSLPQSTIVNWSCGYFKKSLLTADDDNDEIIARREDQERVALDCIAKCHNSCVGKFGNSIANWDTKFETGTKAVVLLPFSPVVIAADENERIRVWNYEEEIPLNNFCNHELDDRGISKLCLVNELDDSLLLVASCNGNVRIWKDFSLEGKQKLVSAFCSMQGHKPGVHTSNVVVDWQQQSGYLYSADGMSSIMLWDLDKEQLISSVTTHSECNISALSASQVHEGQFVAGFVDGSVRLYDIRTPETLACTTRPHAQCGGRVIGICFQPGLDPAKIVSASQEGGIQFLDLRQDSKPYQTIESHSGAVTALSVHRHAPAIASSSSSTKQIVKLFSMEGQPLGTIRYNHPPAFMSQRKGSISCLSFHPYKLLLAAGTTDPFLSIYQDDHFVAK